MINPAEVFVISGLPINDNNIYVARGDSQKRLVRAINANLVPIVYGEYGVGKSSLAYKVAQEHANVIIHIENCDKLNFSDVLDRVIERIQYKKPKTTQVKTKVGGSAKGKLSAEGGIPLIAKAKGEGETGVTGEWEKTNTHDVGINGVSLSQIIEECEKLGVALLIDELHKASEEFRLSLTGFLKTIANKNCKKFKIILLGTANDSTSLVIRDPGISRILSEIHVASMTSAEARCIVEMGMKKLGAKILSRQITAITQTSVGSPSIVQFLSYYSVIFAKEDGRLNIVSGDVKQAVGEYVSSHAQRFISHYKKCVETIGKKRYRTAVLHAIASSNKAYVTMNEIVEWVNAKFLTDCKTPSTALSGPLRDLKGKEYEYILSDVEGLDPKERAYNYSRFSDPNMKTIVKLITKKKIKA